MPEFEVVEQAGEVLTAERLLSLADRTDQVIWDDFLGRRPGESAESLRIRAIDSSFWEVFGDAACLEKVRASFKDVRPAAPEAG